MIHVSLYLVSLIIFWCEGSGKGNVIGVCSSGVRCGTGAGKEVPVVLSPITVPGPSSDGASVGVSCVSTEQRGAETGAGDTLALTVVRTVTAGRGKPRHNAPPPSVHHCHTTPLHHVTTTSYSYCRSRSVKLSL